LAEHTILFIVVLIFGDNVPKIVHTAKKKKVPNILGLKVATAQKVSHTGNNFTQRVEAQLYI
jgi:hypothetical protein